MKNAYKEAAESDKFLFNLEKEKNNLMADASKKIGEYLLKGWTMLGDNCPNGCNVPLMRSRDNKSLLCLGCDTDFLARAAEVVAVSEEPMNGTVGKQISSSNVNALDVIQSKLDWVVQKISETQSISDLHSMVDLATKLVVLRKSI
jgi:uncharacterized Zn finger protein (UPF0148 family)